MISVTSGNDTQPGSSRRGQDRGTENHRLLGFESLGDETVPPHAPFAFRTEKLRLDVPAHWRALLKEWSRCCVLTYNAAVVAVNQAVNVDDIPKVDDLHASLVENSSSFVKKRPFLQDCPDSSRRFAVQRAVGARTTLLTNYWTRPVHLRPPVPKPLQSKSPQFHRGDSFVIGFSQDLERLSRDVEGKLHLRLAPEEAVEAVKQWSKQSKKRGPSPTSTDP